MLSTEQKKNMKKLGITAKKYGGDDEYSWAVFLKGRPMMTGFGKGEVGYYKRRVMEKVMGEMK